VFFAAAVVAILLCSAAPAGSAGNEQARSASGGIIRVLERGLVAVVANGVTGTATYTETNPGKDKGQTTLGVVGHGVFTTKVTPTASAAAAVLGAVKGIPLNDLLDGGSYVTRYDIDAKNGDHGLFVATFRHGLGSICGKFDLARGKFGAGMSFIPTTGSMSSVGGIGKLAALHGAAVFKQTNVTGSNTEKLFENGQLKSVATGSPTPMSSACKAVAKLG
jgi:hypothetical protein